MNNLKHLRLEKKITLRDLADEVNISYVILSRIENGKKIFTEEYILILSKYFKVSTDYLLGLSDVRNIYNNKNNPYFKNDEIKEIFDILNKLSDEGLNILLGFCRKLDSLEQENRIFKENIIN